MTAPAGAVVKTGAPPSAPATRSESPMSETDSVRQLLQMAIEKSMPVESLEKLLAMHERVADRAAGQEFARALAAFQKECPPITHSKKAQIVTKSGGKFSYTYAELDAIAREINPILAKHGLSYSWNTHVDDKGIRLTCECIIRHINGHIAPASSFSLPIGNDSAMSEQQKVGAASTYAKRQTLIAALGITTSDDDFDGAAQVDPTPINDDQVIALEDLLTEAGRTLPKFLEFLGVESLAKLPRVRFNEAKTALENIIAAKAKKANP